jgi:CheY-like chemotaxis protein
MEKIPKILVVEDDDPKWTALKKCLSTNFPQAEVILERSLQSGVRFIRSSAADLILLDMTLPNFDTGIDEPGGVTHSFGGQEFLRQMDRFDVRTPVIVVTQFETFSATNQTLRLPELDQQLKAEHGSVYMGAIYYNAAIQDWESKLVQAMNSILGGKGC